MPAIPESWTGPDETRPLSAKGEKQADRLGRFLAGVGFKPDAIITSPEAPRRADRRDRGGAPRASRSRSTTVSPARLDVGALERSCATPAIPPRPVVVGPRPGLQRACRGAVRGPGGPDAQGRAWPDRHRPPACGPAVAPCTGCSRPTCSSRPARGRTDAPSPALSAGERHRAVRPEHERRQVRGEIGERQDVVVQLDPE